MRPSFAKAHESVPVFAIRTRMTGGARDDRRPVRGVGAFALSVVGIYALTFVSRTIGLLRDSLLARYLGASADSDAFFLGSWLPFYVINVVNMAVTPLIIRDLVREDSGSRDRAAKSFSTLLAVIALPLVAMAVGGRSLLVVSNPGLGDDLLGDAYAVLVVTCLFGYVTSANYVLAAVANSRHRFVVPRLLDTLSPIGACIGILLVLTRFGLVGISLCMLAAAVIAHGGYRALLDALGERVRLSRPSLRDFTGTLANVLPYVLGCIFVNGTFLALMRQVSVLGDGNVTLVMLSDRIWSIVRSATAAVTLAAMPRMAAESNASGVDSRRSVVLPAVYGMAALFVAAMGFLFVAGGLVVRFLFLHGLFAAENASRLTMAVLWYGAAAGLVAVGYFLEYHMIAIGRSAKTVWGGASQLASFLVAIWFLPSAALMSSESVLRVYVLSCLVRVLTLLFLVRDRFAEERRRMLFDATIFAIASSGFLYGLARLGRSPSFDTAGAGSFGAASAAWALAASVYLALLAKAGVPGVGLAAEAVAARLRRGRNRT